MSRADDWTPSQTDWPEWMKHAARDIGVRELHGVATHPRIAEYYRHTQLPEGLDDSETEWCAAAMCCWLEELGYTSPHRSAARSFLGWGEKLDKPRIGCITVFWRERPDSWKGHVGLYAGPGGARQLTLLGGNQGNSVRFGSYARDRVLGYRWPKEQDRLLVK